MGYLASDKHSIENMDEGKDKDNKIKFNNMSAKTIIDSDMSLLDRKDENNMKNTEKGFITKEIGIQFIITIIAGIAIAAATAYLTVSFTRSDANNQITIETKTKVDNIDKNLTDLKSDIKDFKGDVNKRFDKIDDKLDVISKK